jgi:tetratricopeptide (TPR) repeat protein
VEPLFEFALSIKAVQRELERRINDAMQPLGLTAAQAYSKIAPAAAHAQHMTSHIFIAMGMWPEVVQANETAMRIADKARVSHGRPPAGCGHALNWLEYGYLQLGRLGDAKRVLSACAEEAKQRPFAGEGADLLDVDSSSAASFAAQRARYLIDTNDWSSDVAAWSVDASKVPVAEFIRDYVDALAALRQRERAVPAGLVERAERSAAKMAASIDECGLPPKHPSRKVLQLHLDQLHGLQQLREGKAESGLALLRQAAADETALPYEFGPPTILKPGNELLGEVLLELGKPAEARAAFDAALALAPGRVLSVEGRKRSAAAPGGL